MANQENSGLTVARRNPAGSREARRLRRTGCIPGVVYGVGAEPVPFQVNVRELRLALAHSGAVLNLSVDGQPAAPVVVKELTRHPVSGDALHIDLLRVRLDKPIQATVALELVGAEEAPGAREGGVLEHITREVTVEALPNDIPDVIEQDVSEMQINDTVMLEAVRAPANVTILGDPETVVATLTPPRLQVEDEPEIEEETEVVGEGEEPEAEAQAAAEGEGGGEEAAGGD
jgi:large subunit ribosomal protein L25